MASGKRVAGGHATQARGHDIVPGVPTIYCDHNFIATALQEPEEYRNHLQELAARVRVTFVLSPMHWVDAAEDQDIGRGSVKADFMDSLQPRWLFGASQLIPRN